MAMKSNAPTGKIVQIDEAKIQNRLDQVGCGTVEERLNGLLDAEADKLCDASRYERSGERRDYRAGHYNRKLPTKAGEIDVKVQKLGKLTIESAIIESYRRRHASVEQALIQVCLAGILVRRVEGINEAPWGNRVSAGTNSRLSQKAYKRIEVRRNERINGDDVYVYLSAGRAGFLPRRDAKLRRTSDPWVPFSF